MPERFDFAEWREFWRLCWLSAIPTWNRSDLFASLTILGLSIISALMGLFGLFQATQGSTSWSLIWTVPFLVNFVGVAPYRVWSRERVPRAWREIVGTLSEFTIDGQNILNAYGGAAWALGGTGLAATGQWNRAVYQYLDVRAPEFIGEFVADGNLHEARVVWVDQLQRRVQRLAKIQSEIRIHHLHSIVLH